MPDVALNVNQQNWYGWEEISITRSITQIANEFTLKLTDKWSADSLPRPIAEGDVCSVSIDGQTVITGYIDDVDHSYDAESHSLQVQGRDATGDLVDCSAPSFSWASRSLLQGAKALCKPFNIPVSAAVNVGKPFASMKSDEGESVFDMIENAARIRAVLLISDGLGGLVITRAGTSRLSGKLELGINVYAGSQKRSARDRFSAYTVKGQTSDAWTDTASVSAIATDKAVKRHRPKVILADNAVDTASCKELAIWHRNIAAAKSQSINYTFLDWYLDGQLLQPNMLVAVKDHYLKINRDMLIVTVAYIIDDQGLRAELTLALPDAFALTALPEPNDDGGAW